MHRPRPGRAARQVSARGEDPIRTAVSFAARLRLEDVPRQTVEGTKRRVLDVLGAMFAGRDAAGIGDLRAMVAHWGGREESTVVGGGARVPAPLAALVNTSAGRALEWDDVHERGLLHPTVGVVPLALAVAQAAGRTVTGEEFLAAVTAGTEISCRLGLLPDYHVAGELHRPRGWSFTYQCSTLGGALTAGRLLGLDEERLSDCVGLAYSALAGNQQPVQEGVLAIRVQQGLCAQTSVQSAVLARHGISGPREVLEGRFGWLTHWHGGEYDLGPLVDGLGARWETDQISTKPFPCGRITHNAIQAVIDGVGRLPGGAGDVARVTIHVNSRESWDEVVSGVERRRVPATPVDAQFSMPFLCAVAAVHGDVRLEHLGWSGIADREVLAVAQRVVPVLDAESDTSAGRVLPMPIVADIDTVSGERVTVRSDYPLGHPQRPLDWDGVAAKFTGCLQHALGDDGRVAAEAVGEVEALERCPDAGRLAGRVLGWSAGGAAGPVPGPGV